MCAPAAEITVSGGVRPKIGDIDFDLRVTYFLYPGETLVSTTNGIDYWEAAIRADKRITDSVRVAGGFAYSPNVSNTGAWSWYAAAGLGYDVPSNLLPQDVGVSFTGGAGYSWFGPVSGAWGFSATRLSQLASRRHVYAQDVQPRPALLRHQSVEGKLLRFYRRPQCKAGRQRRSRHEPGRPDIALVQRHVCCKVLVGIELATGVHITLNPNTSVSPTSE
jgi:hypothetical protein